MHQAKSSVPKRAKGTADHSLYMDIPLLRDTSLNQKEGEQDEDVFAADVQKAVRAFTFVLVPAVGKRSGDPIAAFCNSNTTGPLWLCIALLT